MRRKAYKTLRMLCFMRVNQTHLHCVHAFDIQSLHFTIHRL